MHAIGLQTQMSTRYIICSSSRIRNLIIVTQRVECRAIHLVIFEKSEEGVHPVGNGIKRSDTINEEKKDIYNSVRELYPLMCGKLCLYGFIILNMKDTTIAISYRKMCSNCHEQKIKGKKIQNAIKSSTREKE